MKRPQRNLLLFLSLLIIPSISRALDIQLYAFIFSIIAVTLAVLMIFLGKDYFVARFKIKYKNWSSAVESFSKFESFLDKLHALHLKVPFFFSLYTYNGKALTKNNIAFCYMNSGKITEAKRLLAESIELDRLYAIPHVNLAIIAAMEGDADRASSEANIAKELGFRGKGAQLIIRRILVSANETMGKALY